MPSFTYSTNCPPRAALRKCEGENNQMNKLHEFRIWPVLNAQSLQKFDFTHYEIRLNPHTDQAFPLPWDAGFEINGEGLLLEGSAGPCGFGSALVMLSHDDYLRLSEAEENEKPFWILVDMTLDQAAQVEHMGWEVKGNK